MYIAQLRRGDDIREDIETYDNASRLCKLPKLLKWGCEYSADGRLVLGVTVNLLIFDRVHCYSAHTIV